ncbi:MAG TPA: polysaccharide biosynthesis tyrosine autokinase, partial [Lentisphaerae bacterium]|nr:polysaccharide biosynthesis tyrosine autokinase [Lentisphaerota bacterium]
AHLTEKEVEPLGDYIATQQQIIYSKDLIQRARQRIGRTAEEFSRLLVNLNVAQVWKTSLLRITVDALDPVFAKEFANALAEEYLDYKAEERMDTSQATVLSLTQQANRLREELQRAENRMLAFEKENKVIAIRERGNIAADVLASLSAKAANYRTQRMLLEAEQPLLSKASDEIVLEALAAPMPSPLLGYSMPAIAMMRAGGTGTVVVTQSTGPESLLERGVVKEPGWEKLRREKARLELELKQLRRTFKDSHPKVQEVLRKLDDINRRLELEVQFALKSYYNRLQALQIKEQAAKRVEAEWEAEALEVARKAHEYENLQRSVARLQSLYDLVFNRLKEVDVSIGIEPERIRIVERAEVPTSPVTPRKLQSIFIAALIGLGIGIGLVFGLEYLDDTIRYPEEVTEGLGLPFFGVVPTAQWDPEDLSTHVLSNIDSRSGVAEAYRNVRSALIFSGAEEYTKALVVTSAVPLEGKTTTCLNVGISLGQAGSRVLLVDADLRRGTMHKFFGSEADRGLTDILVGRAKPEAVIQRTPIPNVDFVSSGPYPPNPAELLMRPELAAFLDYARRTYDRVMFDCPPVLAVSEAAILCTLVDGVIFVVWAGQTSRKLSQLAVQTLRERGANILGCVLNNLDFSRVGYYYYSTYYGYYDYDYRYPSQQRAGESAG